MLITQHLGLGDAIICQAIVKLYSKRYQNIEIPIDQKFQESISKIYTNFDNVNFVSISNINNSGYKTIEQLISNYTGKVLRIGFFSSLYGKIVNNIKTLNSTFYVPAKIDQSKQWQVPVLQQRDSERQKELFGFYGVKEKEYVLIVQDRNRLNQNNKRMIINRSYIKQKELPIVQLEHKTNNIFDNCYLLQNAAQIHIYDTAMMHVLDQCCYVNPEKVNVHKYVRPQQKRVTNVYKYPYNMIW